MKTTLVIIFDEEGGWEMAVQGKGDIPSETLQDILAEVSEVIGEESDYATIH
jgi:hypothetical protein